MCTVLQLTSFSSQVALSSRSGGTLQDTRCRSPPDASVIAAFSLSCASETNGFAVRTGTPEQRIPGTPADARPPLVRSGLMQEVAHFKAHFTHGSPWEDVTTIFSGFASRFAIRPSVTQWMCE